MITTVFFDWGGVLAKGGHSFWKTVQEMMGVTINEQDMQDFRALRVALNSGEINEKEFSDQLELLTRVKVPSAVWEVEEIVNILPKMQEFVLGLKNRGLKVGIISNMSKIMSSNIKASGGYAAFNLVINSCEVGFMKPRREIFDIALERSKEKPKNCLFIDDLEPNLVYPSEIGMKTVFAVNTEQVIRDVSKLLG